MRFLRLIRSPRGAGSPVVPADFAVYILLLLLGILQLVYCPRAADFVNDAVYPDLARSMLEKGSYEFNHLPETTLPPGLPLCLALVGWFAGLSPAVLFRVMTVCTTLGLIAAYELLRRVEGRGMAATVCLLFGLSPALFRLNSHVVFSEMPYFLVSMLALLLTLKLDRTASGRARFGWILLLSATLVLAVLIRSIGITLVIGLCTWVVAPVLVVPSVSRRRIKWFLIPIALGFAAQLVWTEWAQRRQTTEWQLGGWPQSYITQLKLKNGNQPELGMAHLSDIPSRIGQNIVARPAVFGQSVIGWWVSRLWFSPAIIGVLVLITIGLASSFRNGGQLHDWYFLWHESIYLLWPWNTEDRFVYPVVPLACLYLWRGAKALKNYAIRRPERISLSFVLCGLLLASSSAACAIWIFRSTPFASARMDHVQSVAATLFWIALTVIGFRMLRSQARSNSTVGMPVHLSRGVAKSEIRMPLRAAAITALVVLVAGLVTQDVHIGRDNISFDITKAPFYPEIEAAEWIRTHEPPDRVIMARKQDLVFHYSHHRVVWFPPISAANVLMQGIQRHHVTVVVVAHHTWNYWLPPEDVCWQSLSQAYGEEFTLVHHGPDVSVFDVSESSTARTSRAFEGAPRS